MSKLTLIENSVRRELPAHIADGKRHLTLQEIQILKQNDNISDDSEWQNIYVSAGQDEFSPYLVRHCTFYGFVVLGKLRPATLKYHDLELHAGLYNSRIEDTVLGDDDVVSNVSYLVNYHIGDRVILFNIQEMSCTNHSKFGNGILKQGEPEENRVWIGVGNENDNRAVLPFENMIPADAYLWSRYRDDKVRMQKFIDLTEYGNNGTRDTYGIVEDDAVVKNTTLIKDAKI